MPRTNTDSTGFKPKTFVATIPPHEEKCVHCSVLLPALAGGERSISQLQCNACAQKEMEWWLKEVEAMTSGQLSQDEHAVHIAGQVMRCPKIYKESVVEWAKKMMR